MQLPYAVQFTTNPNHSQCPGALSSLNWHSNTQSPSHGGGVVLVVLVDDVLLLDVDEVDEVLVVVGLWFNSESPVYAPADLGIAAHIRLLSVSRFSTFRSSLCSL